MNEVTENKTISNMTKEQIQTFAEQTSRKFNPKGLSPYPFMNIPKENGDLTIYFASDLSKKVSGAIGYFSDKPINFVILINKNEHVTRRNFTIAHELGHYFLHKDEIKKEIIVDEKNVLIHKTTLLYRDDKTRTRLEVEANNFAASFLMPADLTEKAWKKLKDIEQCAEIFNVSVEAMTIRLSRLGLVI